MKLTILTASSPRTAESGVSYVKLRDYVQSPKAIFMPHLDGASCGTQGTLLQPRLGVEVEGRGSRHSRKGCLEEGCCLKLLP
jgi:hypothetical protein